MKYLYIIVLCFFPLITGCASILGSTADTVVINSLSQDKYVKIYNLDNKVVEEGSLPLIANLKKGRGYFKREHYFLVSYDENGERNEYKLVPGISPLYFLSAIIPGAVIGMVTIDSNDSKGGI